MAKQIKAKDFFNKRAKSYSKVSKWSVNEKLNSKTDEFLKDVKGNIAIEVGAGTGVLISRLKNFKRRIALDISKEMLSEIEDKSVEKVVGDVEELKFPKNYFDLIICRQLLHYCDLDVALENIKRVIKKNGLLHVVQVVDFKKVPESWDLKWASFRRVSNRKHSRTKELEDGFNKFSFETLRCEKLILRDSYSWTDFFLKHNISKEDEKNVRQFFQDTPKYISDAIKLEFDKNKISYNRLFRFWLLKSK
ncbi:MAG: Ubiquinone/menaquinone biosynthesis C-methyltransferase UbiE [Saprospiraceae bacterium]|jgi:ubiquinone/menaquinone biosynthesis C-methylase UbiE|nr:Ubiquinone/menaquinone biosynthesis C-methyltransferase UbiE [Saprospiraceae bacterium]